MSVRNKNIFPTAKSNNSHCRHRIPQITFILQESTMEPLDRTQSLLCQVFCERTLRLYSPTPDVCERIFFTTFAALNTRHTGERIRLQWAEKYAGASHQLDMDRKATLYRRSLAFQSCSPSSFSLPAKPNFASVRPCLPHPP